MRLVRVLLTAMALLSPMVSRAQGFDFNVDGIVDHNDLEIFKSFWLQESVAPFDPFVFANEWFSVVGGKDQQAGESPQGEKGTTFPGTLGVDLVRGFPRFEFGSGIVIEDDVDIDLNVSARAGELLRTVVRLNGTINLLGVKFDLSFDSSRLEIVNIFESLGDLDYNGRLSFSELVGYNNFFTDTYPAGSPVSDFNFTFHNGQTVVTTGSSTVLDANLNGVFDFQELSRATQSFLSYLSSEGLPFWTQILSNRNGFNPDLFTDPVI